ncbi:MAG: sulfotransferase domain-containing protein [Acidimicrobiia bacterium]
MKLVTSSLLARLRGRRVVLPNFLIIGVSKGGTTWLFHLLRQHPDVYMAGQGEILKEADLARFVPKAKEPHFFDSLREMETLGLKGYSRKYFENGREEKAIGEASGSYLLVPDGPEDLVVPARDFNPDIPATVRETLGPNTRLIVSLRNPTDRFISWAFQHKKIYPQKTGTYIVHQEARRGQLYLGFYYRHLTRWRQYFDPANFSVLIYEEDIERNRRMTAHKLTRFLGVDEFEFQGMDEHYNVRQPYRQEGDDFYIRKVSRPDEWELFISAKEVKRLRDLYQDVPKKTGELLGRDLSIWEEHG